MQSFLPPLCQVCEHGGPDTKPACDAFPGGIPKSILSGEIWHLSPYSGDQGIRFRKKHTAESYFITGDDSLEILFRITSSGTCERYVPIFDTWEQDTEFIIDLLAVGDEFRLIDSYEADAFVESAQIKKEAMNPCSLHFKQMVYLQSRQQDQEHPPRV
ncbi:MAG: hypothetical protein LUQ31_00565 [Methanoregula sp.]|nr:hypothetical protein [Methanoregula sp.]